MGVLNVDNIKNDRQECLDFCLAAAKEFPSAAEQVGLACRGINVKAASVRPAWPVTKTEGGFFDRREWAEYWMIIYNDHSGSSIVDIEWSAVISKGGDFYISSQKVTAEQFAKFIADYSEYDRSKAEAVFQQALKDSPVSGNWLRF